MAGATLKAGSLWAEVYEFNSNSTCDILSLVKSPVAAMQSQA